MINYESPVFVNIVLFTIYTLLLLTVGLTVWSVVRSVRQQGKSEAWTHGIPRRRIIVGTLALLLVTLGATWLLASTKPLKVNSNMYDNSFWLHASDMLIFTPIVLMVVIAVLMIIAEVVRRKNHV